MTCIITIKFHKHIIPYLQSIIFIRFWSRSFWREKLFSYPIKYFRIRSARSNRPRTPSIILSSHIRNSLFRHAGLFSISCSLIISRRIFVSFKNRNCQFFGIEFQFIDKEFSTPLNSLFFEIITQRSIPHHFKKSEMTCITDFIDIDSSDTFLYIKKFLAQRMFFTRKIRDQLLHSRNSEHSSAFLASDQWTLWQIYMLFIYPKSIPMFPELFRWYIVHKIKKQNKHISKNLYKKLRIYYKQSK